MGIRRTAGSVLTAVVVLAALAMVGGQLAGQPVLLSYVETGSMEPTLHPGDGFIAVPAAVAGPVEQGDVVVFEAQNLHGGGLTTHRVVGETEAGYVTKGDANPTTDQSGPEPPVTRSQIKAKALQIGGSVVVIPNLGLVVIVVQEGLQGLQQTLATALGTRALLGPQGLAYLLAGLGIVAYAVTLVFEDDSDRHVDRTRERTTGVVDGSLVIVGLTVVLVAVLTASMAVPSGVQSFEFVASEVDAPGPSVIAAGTTEKVTYRVPSNGFFPVVTFLEPRSNRLTVSSSEVYVGGGDVRTVIVELSAPAETGSYALSMVEHRYLAVVPQSTIRTLYRVHPWAPIVVIDAIVGVGFVSLALALIGIGPVRLRSRSGGGSLLDRLREWLP